MISQLDRLVKLSPGTTPARMQPNLAHTGGIRGAAGDLRHYHESRNEGHAISA